MRHHRAWVVRCPVKWPQGCMALTGLGGNSRSQIFWSLASVPEKRAAAYAAEAQFGKIDESQIEAEIKGNGACPAGKQGWRKPIRNSSGAAGDHWRSKIA